MANKLLAIIDAAIHGRRMPKSATRAQIQRAETIINRHKKARLKAEDKEDEDDDNDTGAPPPPENGSCSTCSGTGKCKDCDGSGKAPADDDEDEDARAHHHHRGKLTKPRNLREGINQLMRLTAQVNAQVGGKTGPSTPAAAANPFPHLAMLETIKAQYDATYPWRASKFLSDNHEEILAELELQRWQRQDAVDARRKAELAERRQAQQDALNREQQQKAELARLESQAAELRKRINP